MTQPWRATHHCALPNADHNATSNLLGVRAVAVAVAVAVRALWRRGGAGTRDERHGHNIGTRGRLSTATVTLSRARADHMRCYALLPHRPWIGTVRRWCSQGTVARTRTPPGRL